jgi:hypothetical protein
MGGVYGDQLAFFPELFVEHEVFDMKARTGGGYGPRYNKRMVSGVFQWIPGGKMGIEGENREPNEDATFWVRQEALEEKLVRQGSYVEVFDEGIFLFHHDDNFTREGAFVKCDLKLVAGLTDRQVRNTKVDLGVSDYD